MALMNPLLKNGISAWPTGRPIKAMPMLKKLLLDTGAKVFLGLEMGPEADKINQAFIDILAGSTDPFRKKAIWFSPYAKGVRGNKTLATYVLKAIPQRRKAEGRDFLTQFCQLTNDDGELFSDDEICDHIMFMLFAAHDTTTSALSSLMYALASNEDWQEQLRQEMLDLNKEELEFDDVELLKKTGLTIKESLRMYPSVPLVPRYALKDFEFQGHRIPANSAVFGNSIFCHYMEEYWTNPHQFDPYRFSPERAEDKKDFYQYTPFGGGAHKCLGMHFAEVQVKMFLFHFLKSYKVSKNPNMTRYKYNNFPLTFPTDGLPLTLTKI
jgi:cytochrome P450